MATAFPGQCIDRRHHSQLHGCQDRLNLQHHDEEDGDDQVEGFFRFRRDV